MAKAEKAPAVPGELCVKLTFTEELLGTAPQNPELYENYIAKKAGITEEKTDNELGTLPELEDEVDKGTTVFHRMADGRLMLYDYQIKGFFKDACGCLSRVSGTRSDKLKAFKKVIDGIIFINEREIPIELGGDLGMCDRAGICVRSLRVNGPQGERVALARSETAPAGSSITFTVDVLDSRLLPVVKDWLEYGRKRGLGQWRNSGKGRFTYEILSEG